MLIAQITDTHVKSDGVEQRYLMEAIDWIGALQPRPDVVLLTGDTTDHGTAVEYAALRAILGRSPIPVFIVPGNHDARRALREQLPEAFFPGLTGDRMNYCIETFPVRLIGLDTSARRWPGGVLAAADLAWLDAKLEAARERPALIFMHHPPFRTGVNAADAFGFIGLHALTAIVRRRTGVRQLIAGHIHCDRRAQIGAATATTAPSTTPQDVPELFERRLIGMRTEAAGFALHAWRDGTFATTTYQNAGSGRFVERAAG